MRLPSTLGIISASDNSALPPTRPQPTHPLRLLVSLRTLDGVPRPHQCHLGDRTLLSKLMLTCAIYADVITHFPQAQQSLFIHVESKKWGVGLRSRLCACSTTRPSSAGAPSSRRQLPLPPPRALLLASRSATCRTAVQPCSILTGRQIATSKATVVALKTGRPSKCKLAASGSVQISPSLVALKSR